ncbi:unnamed protein product, partial [Polarella glacialis]
ATSGGGTIKSVELRLQVASLRRELDEQRFARSRAEAEAKSLSAEVERLGEDREDILRRLRSAERATMASDMQVRQLLALAEREKVQSPSRRDLAAKSIEDVISSLVSLELRQLSSLPSQERAAAKRKLLLRWHPDKNVGSGGGCSDLANRVVQEMQGRPEWESS